MAADGKHKLPDENQTQVLCSKTLNGFNVWDQVINGDKETVDRGQKSG